MVSWVCSFRLHGCRCVNYVRFRHGGRFEDGGGGENGGCVGGGRKGRRGGKGGEERRYGGEDGGESVWRYREGGGLGLLRGRGVFEDFGGGVETNFWVDRERRGSESFESQGS